MSYFWGNYGLYSVVTFCYTKCGSFMKNHNGIPPVQRKVIPTYIVMV